MLSHGPTTGREPYSRYLPPLEWVQIPSRNQMMDPTEVCPPPETPWTHYPSANVPPHPDCYGLVNGWVDDDPYPAPIFPDTECIGTALGRADTWGATTQTRAGGSAIGPSDCTGHPRAPERALEYIMPEIAGTCKSGPWTVAPYCASNKLPASSGEPPRCATYPSAADPSHNTMGVQLGRTGRRAPADTGDSPYMADTAI